MLHNPAHTHTHFNWTFRTPLSSARSQVHTICSNANMLMGYNGLFAKGFQNLSNIQAEYEREFGDSYDMFDPQLLQLMEEAHRSSLPSNPDFTQRRAICAKIVRV